MSSSSRYVVALNELSALTVCMTVFGLKAFRYIIPLNVRGRMHGNETDPRTALIYTYSNMSIQIRKITGRGRCDANELEFFRRS